MGLIEDWVHTVRARDWASWAITYVLGAVFAGVSSLENFLLGIIVCGPLLGSGAFTINQYFDIRTDAMNVNKRKLAIPSGRKKRGSLLTIGIFSFATALLTALLLGTWFFETTLFITFLCVAYSAPPLRFKRIMFFDLFINALGGYLFFIAGVSLNANPWSAVYPMGVFMAMVWASGHTIQAIGDFEADRKAGIRTTVVWLGKENMKKLLMAVIALQVIYFNYMALTSLGAWFLLVNFPGVYWIYANRGVLSGDPEAVKRFDETKVPMIVAILMLILVLLSVRTVL